MLAASIQLPNTERTSEHAPEHMRPAPTPQNWCGVVEGMQQARLYITSGQAQLAVDSLKEVLEFAPSETEAWNLLAEILQQHGLTQKSDACLQKAARLQQNIMLDNSEAPASIRLAKLMWAQGETDTAQAMINTLLETQADHQELLQLQTSWQLESDEEEAS